MGCSPVGAVKLVDCTAVVMPFVSGGVVKKARQSQFQTQQKEVVAQNLGVKEPLGSGMAPVTCSDSICKITSCGFGFADCDGIAANGCEVSKTTMIIFCLL
jgi:hypothetical protein